MPRPSLILRSPYLQWLLVQIFPRLRAWPVGKWPAVMEKVRCADFDRIERIGIVAAVVLTTWLLRPASGSNSPAAIVFLTQLPVALPLLFLMAGPFFLRRIRRVIDSEARSGREGRSDDPDERK
ncbi:MAG: hypothetical protein ACK4FP_10810 [Azonexus sp.]